MKKTPWFPGTVKPVRRGVYEVKLPPGPWFRYWDGIRWCLGGHTPQQAMKMRDRSEPWKPDPWRGLAEKP